MGKNKKRKGKKKPGSKKKPVDVDSLLAAAEAELEKCEPIKALAILKELITRAPTHTPGLDLLGQAFSEVGDLDQAKKALQTSCQLAPDSAFEKWMLLGQLMTGMEAVKCFEKGILVMGARHATARAAMQQPGEQGQRAGEEVNQLARQMSSGYCSAVEIFQTDCCDLPNAEAQCEKLLQVALSTCPTNAEVHYAISNFRFLQHRKGESLGALQQCFATLNAESQKETSAGVEWPGLSETAAKLALELEQYPMSAELFELALKEDDTDTQLWFLAGYCHCKTGEVETGRAYYLKTIQMLEKDPQPELLADVMKELQSLPKEVPGDSASAGVGGGGGEDVAMT